MIYHSIMISEKRKEYLKIWRISNRKRIREKYRSYFRNYMKKWRIVNKKSYAHGVIKTGTKVFLGRQYELLALKLLQGSTDCNDKCFAGPWDIEWGVYKIEV